MSILGAVSIGTKAGEKISNAIFNYSKNQYLDKITELDGLIVRLNGHLTELENLRAEVPSFWNDSGSEVALKNLDTTIAATRRSTDYAKSLMETFQKTVSEMDQSQSGLDAALDVAQTILSALNA